MKYYSHYLWESAGRENPVSLVLQQVKLKKGRCLLACICDGSGSEAEGSLISGYFTERLVEWFHHDCLPAIKQSEKTEKIHQLLEKEIKSIERELENYGAEKQFQPSYNLSGMLVWGEQFCCFERGDVKSLLFNRRFNKKQCQDLSQMLFGKNKGEGMLLISGTLQKGISILISTVGFCEHISEKEMLEVLFEEKAKDGEIQKRLKELWKEDMVRGGAEYAGAVFFRVG